MSQPAYDRSLLAAAPALTRADRQAGYDVNALEQGSYYTSTRPSAPAPAPAPVLPAADPFTDQQYYERQSPVPSVTPSTKKPWYRTRRGQALIALAVIILIGLIAGIAAGTAAARQSRNTTLLSDNTNSQNQDQATQTQATDSPTSPIANLPSSSDTGTNTTPVPLGQQPAATLTFGNGNGNGNGATPTSRGGSNQPTTIIFGGASSQPGIIQPTQGTGGIGSGGDDDGEDIPLICITFPQLRDCAPYYENGP